jgi:hypothetical protein
MTNKNTPADSGLVKNEVLSNSNYDSEADSFLDQQFKSKTGRPSKLSFSNLIKCLELKRKYACETWKGLYRCLVDKREIGELGFELPSYANFLKSIKKLIFYLFFLIHYQTTINRKIFLKQRVRIAFVDSTSLSVCHIKRSSRHKVMQDFDDCPPEYSKTTMGWFYGYKLHLITDYDSNYVLDFQFSNAKLDDRQYLKEKMEKEFYDSKTMFVADKGYQAKWLEDLAQETNNYLLTGKKKSKQMKTLASQFDIYLLHVRARVESVFSNLKQNCFLTNTRSRSTLGYLFNYVLSMYYLIFKEKMNFDI